MRRIRHCSGHHHLWDRSNLRVCATLAWRRSFLQPLCIGRTRMKRFLFALVAVIGGCSDGSRPGSSYAEVTNAAHDCAKEANASIASSDAAFKLTSTCERILVKGGNNKITIEAAKRIDVNGAKNVIEVGAADTIRITEV